MSVVDDRRERDGAGVVDDDVDAAELRRGLVDRLLDVGLVADVDDERQRLAAGALDVLGGGVDGAGELRVRLGGLGRDRDIGAVAGGAQSDRQPDAARGAGDEQGLAELHATSLRPHFLRARNAWNAARASSDCRSSAKCIDLGFDPRGDLVGLPRKSRRAAASAPRRQRGDLLRRLQRDFIERAGLDHGVDDAGVLGLRGGERAAHRPAARTRARNPCAAAPTGSRPLRE